MFDLEKEIRKWLKALRRSENLEDSDIAELESHLRDEIDHQINKGLDEESAFRAALEKSAPADTLREEYNKAKLYERSRPYWHPSHIMPSLIWSYVKIALRKIKRHKGFSLINIAGLSIGMSVCILVMTFIQYEFSFDRFHENSDSIYRIASRITYDTGTTITLLSPSWMATALVENYLEIKDSVRIYRHTQKSILGYKDVKFQERLLYADPTFFSIFTFPLMRGDEKTALVNPNCVVITPELAEKCFGKENPMGKVLTVNNKHNFKVTGVLKEIPRNSHMKFNFIASYSSLRNIYDRDKYDFFASSVTTYLLLARESTSEGLNEKINALFAEREGKEMADRTQYFLQPLTSIHLHSDIGEEFGENSRIFYSYGLAAVALLVLAIACINFVNMSTARATQRSREVGIKKVIGARKSQLFRQFLGESMIFSFLSLFLALILASFLLPLFNRLLSRDMEMDFTSNPVLYLGILMLTLLVGFVSGAYPAVFLSSFQPVESLKGKLRAHSGASSLIRRVLVILQFTVSLIFIIGVIIIVNQMNYIKNRNLGFFKDCVIRAPLLAIKTVEERYESIKYVLLQNPHIQAVTSSYFEPGVDQGIDISVVPGGAEGGEPVTMNLYFLNYDFFDFFEIEFIEGRNFNKERITDFKSGVILNEKAAKIAWRESASGKQIKYTNGQILGTVIGVVKDFHTSSLHTGIIPTIFKYNKSSPYFYIKVNPARVQDTLAYVKEVWHEFAPELVFTYSFLEENIEALYREEQKTGAVFTYSAALAIIIACLGLLGLTFFMIERRVKEIGIRKVLGSSVGKIVLLINREFTKWVLTANLLSWPVAYFIMNNWLERFAYRINISLWMFVLSGIMVYILAGLTVSYLSIKAATANPVDSLRYE